jgi:hypothetical protein
MIYVYAYLCIVYKLTKIKSIHILTQYYSMTNKKV